MIIYFYVIGEPYIATIRKQRAEIYSVLNRISKQAILAICSFYEVVIFVLYTIRKELYWFALIKSYVMLRLLAATGNNDSHTV